LYRPVSHAVQLCACHTRTLVGRSYPSEPPIATPGRPSRELSDAIAGEWFNDNRALISLSKQRPYRIVSEEISLF
jgi:hypothetical protein